MLAQKLQLLFFSFLFFLFLAQSEHPRGKLVTGGSSRNAGAIDVAGALAAADK